MPCSEMHAVMAVILFYFQVAHVAFLQQKDGALAHDWAAAQVATTADFAHGSFFWTHFSGGLNYQVHTFLASYALVETTEGA